MELTFDRLCTEEMVGLTEADFLVLADAHFRLLAGDLVLVDEPGFPVVELARELARWISDPEQGDFLFDSMSYEEVGTVSILRVGGGWAAGSVFNPEVEAPTLEWSIVELACRRFVTMVERAVAELGGRPPRADRRLAGPSRCWGHVRRGRDRLRQEPVRPALRQLLRQ